MRPPEVKSILVNIITNSDLESNATLKVNYSNEDKGEREKKVDINFVSDSITITPFTNNSAILKIVTQEDKQLKDEPKQIEPKQIPLKITANISFPQTITNRGGDIYYINKSITMQKYSDLTLTLLPPLTFNEQLDNFAKSIQPINVLWGTFTTIGLGISGFIAFLYKRRKDKLESMATADNDQDKVKKDNNKNEVKRSPI